MAIWTTLSALGLALWITASGGPAAAQSAAEGAPDPVQGLDRLTRDAVLVSQAIGWGLAGPLHPAEAAPVAFAAEAQPQPVAYGGMATDKVMLLDYGAMPGQPHQRALAGVVELADSLGHRIFMRFDAIYDVAPSGTFFVTALAVAPVAPPSPRIEAYVVPATIFGPRGLTGMTPFAMVEAIRRNAVDPATRDDTPRHYQVYVVVMDRLPDAAGIGFTAIDGATGRAIGRSQNIRSNGWVVSGIPLTFAMNGPYGVYFPVAYRPDDAVEEERILMVFSNRTDGGAQPAVPGGPRSLPAPSAVGQRFLAKGFPSQPAGR